MLKTDGESNLNSLTTIFNSFFMGQVARGMDVEFVGTIFFKGKRDPLCPKSYMVVEHASW